MLNRNSSARTAAQKSSKCSLFIRQATIAAILMLAAGLLSSCEMPKEKEAQFVESYNYGNVRVIEVDSCQYVIYNVYGGYSITHKGNCKYCLARKK